MVPIAKAIGKIASKNLGIANPMSNKKYPLDASEPMINSKNRIDCVNNTIMVRDIATTHVDAKTIFKTYLSKMDNTLERLRHRFILG